MHEPREVSSGFTRACAERVDMSGRFERISVDWVRAVRGRRSQRAFSRRLGYSSNIAYRWEAGHCWPTARVVLSIMQRLRVDVRAALTRFYGNEPSWLAKCDPTSREGIAQLLDDLHGGTSIVQLAARSGFSRHQVARWLAGATEPKLPEWLALIDAASFRLLDFVAAFFDPSKLQSIANDWKRLVTARDAVYSRPEIHIVLRSLELVDYQALQAHDDAFLARRTNLTQSQVRDCLQLLNDSGQIRKRRRKWTVAESSPVDTRHDVERARALRGWWLRRMADQVEAGREGIYGYNLFSIAERDLAILREMHVRYYREMQELIAQSHPNERIVLFGAQLVCLDTPSE
jgi:transcriptional regulator with XRE-family HTH domain